MTFGPWILRAFALLARARHLRGTLFDPFVYTDEDRMERSLIEEYHALIDRVLARLTEDNFDAVVALVASAQDISGFGRVKQRTAPDGAASTGAV